MAKQAIPYIRYSSFKQSESNSYERQREAVDRWCKQHPEYTRSELVFDDLGRSGFSTNASKKASGLIKVRAAIEAGAIRAGDVLLIEAFDRATRQQALDAIELITPILRAGVSIITLDDNVEYTQDSLNGSHAYLLVAKIQAAHGYSKILSDRVKESYRLRREQAKAKGGIKRHTPVWLKTDGTVIPDIAVQVAQVFDWYIAGVGKHTIASKVRQSGIDKLATCSGPTVQSWLTNPAVIGTWETSESIPGVYERIITDDVWHLTQKLLKERATEPRKRASKHFLVGLVKCKHCQSSMIMHIQNGAPIAMRCLSHHRLKEAGCTNNRSIPINIIKLVQVLTSNLAFRRAMAKQTLTASEKRKIVVQGRLVDVSAKIGRLLELVLAGDVPEVAARLGTLKQERQELEAELASIEAGSAVVQESLRAIREESVLLAADPLVLNAMLKDSDYAIWCSAEGTITTSESRTVWKYLGVKRKAKSNQTEAYRVSDGSNLILIAPDPAITVAPMVESGSEVDIRSARYSQLVLDVINGEGEEEMLDPPYVQWQPERP